MRKIDINCDLGESYGNFIVGNDKAVFPYISSCNIACGFHGGDPLHIDETIRLAIEHQVRIGAHPSYPDLQGFGRRKMELSSRELRAIVKYQVAALKGMVASHGGNLSYVKPHGALYNSIAHNKVEAETVVEAILAIDEDLALMGLANSPLATIAQQKGIDWIPEAFADRKYKPDGTLMSRSQKDAVLHDPDQVAQQVLSIALHQKVETEQGLIPIQAESICVHGDNLEVITMIQKVSQILLSKGVFVKSSQ